MATPVTQAITPGGESIVKRRRDRAGLSAFTSFIVIEEVVVSVFVAKDEGLGMEQRGEVAT